MALERGRILVANCQYEGDKRTGFYIGVIGPSLKNYGKYQLVDEFSSRSLEELKKNITREGGRLAKKYDSVFIQNF